MRVNSPLAFFLVLGTSLGARPDAQSGATVDGRVWLDVDEDGVAEGSEPGLPGVVVRLLDQDGVPVPKVRVATDADGRYELADLSPGTYRVGFARPAGHRFTRTSVGSLDAQGTRVLPGSRSDDSDLNLDNGWLDPSRRGPLETGMSYFELTRIDASGDPWPVNGWVAYPAEPGSSAAPRATVRDLYRHDDVDIANRVAIVKLTHVNAGGSAGDVDPADPDSVVPDIEARVDAPPVSQGGPYPVALLFSGLAGETVDMIDLGDQLASHGYVALCLESTAFHGSLALGSRLLANGGPWAQSDFDHIPQLSSSTYAALLTYGYTPQGFLMGDYPGPSARQEGILAADASFALTQAQGWNGDPDHELAGLLDPERVGWIGFSAGAARSARGLSNDRRFDLLVNVDSAVFVNIERPTLYVGNHSGSPPLGPTVQARLLGDYHPHYIFIPSVRFDPPQAASAFHREYQHAFRDELVTAFCGLFLKDVLGYRADLGLDGHPPLFDGYVRPYLTSRINTWASPPFTVGASGTQTFDAGLSSVRLWALDGNRLFSFGTGFLPAASSIADDFVDHGPILVRYAGALHPLGIPAQGLAIDEERNAWFLAGSAPALFKIELDELAPGGPVVAHWMGGVSGLPGRPHALSYDPRSGQLFAVGGPSARRLFSFTPGPRPRALDLGELPDELGVPGRPAVDGRGRTWIPDSAGTRLTRFSPGTFQVLDDGELASAPGGGGLGSGGFGVVRAGIRSGQLAYDEVSELLFAVDTASGELVSFDPDTGSVRSYDSLYGLGLESTLSLAAERRSGHGLVSRVTGAVLAAPTGGGPAPILEDVHVSEPAGGWEGCLLRVQVAEGTGSPGVERLSLASAGNVLVGPRAVIELPELLIGEAWEILWQGQVVGWLEDDWGQAVGGLRLAPLRIAFSAAATGEAVGDVIEALRYAGPRPRRLELELFGPDGQRGLAEVVELRP